MKILFLDQSGQIGGAELCLIEIAKPYRDRCQVCLFTDGPFRQLLEKEQIPVQVLATKAVRVSKDSGWFEGITSLGQLLPLIVKVALLSRDFDLIYANTQKALVVGSIASFLSRRPLVYHLHDILSPEHFSRTNLSLAVTLANRFASKILATSKAAQTAFIQAGGRSNITEVVYNGFDPTQYQCDRAQAQQLKRELRLQGKYLIGHFSRLSPWKGQHVLLEALQHCPEDVVAIFVGDALYGEQAYAEALQIQVTKLNLQDRVRFLGFRSDIVPLMHGCDAIVHTSTAPEPFGRVVVEAMLCERPVIATQAGGVVELIEPGVADWLVPSGDPEKLASIINLYRSQQELTQKFAHQARIQVSQRFHRDVINQQIAQLLNQIPVKVQSERAVIEPQSLTSSAHLERS
jgi:glycosyltransferase involved in cell wall biosynthesis